MLFGRIGARREVLVEGGVWGYSVGAYLMEWKDYQNGKYLQIWSILKL
jgi:hypothetical protein